MKFLYALTALASLACASPVSSSSSSSSSSGNGQAQAHAEASASSSSGTTPSELPRLLIYYQTTHDSTGRPISMLPLVNEKNIALTHLIVCSLHINKGGVVHLNDFPPSNDRFKTLWKEAGVLKKSGVKIMGMVGGAAPGSFDEDTLDGDQEAFDYYYGQLRDVIKQFGLEGMDIDVEQSMSQAGINRLINQLYKDFGPKFIITLAPVSSALNNGGNLSGFDYKVLEKDLGSKIAFYNGQFYSGFGSMSSPSDYQAIVKNGFKPSKVIAGQLTSPSNGYGYIPYSQLNATVIKLRKEYGQIGGVMGWEYFNSKPGDTSKPWQWAQIMTEILRPNSVPKMKITYADAKSLTETYAVSKKAAQSGNAARADDGDVDYFAMITE